MIWVYAAILAFSAGLCTVVLVRSTSRLASFLGMVTSRPNVLALAALAALMFLMIAQAPAMMLTAALMLWIAGSRHAHTPLSVPVQIGLVIIVVFLGVAALGSPHFALPPTIPKAAVMGAVALLWALLLFFPLGAVSHGQSVSYLVALSIFSVGAVVFTLPLSLASDAIVIAGAVVGALWCLGADNGSTHKAGEWVWLYLLGYLASSAAYAGAWWLGLLGIAPVCVYALMRRT